MNISVEIEKLGEFVNSNEILKFKDYKTKYCLLKSNTKVVYLLYVLELTYNNPEIQVYLKQLLKNYSATELNDLGANFSGCTILHCMIGRLSNISLNSFEVIINFGIDVNSQDKHGNTPLHYLYAPSKHLLSVIGLFVKYGADLNILGYQNKTVLDEFMDVEELDEDLEIIMMTLIDFGAKNYNIRSGTSVKVLEFIESYRSNSIKPAIKK